MANPNPPDDIESLRKQVSSYASWFYWIAGMTVVNCVMIHSGSETSFLIGLTIGMVVDAMTADAGSTAKIFAASFDAICVGSLIFLGVKARQGVRWAFVVGIILYGMDTLLSLLAPSAVSIAVHAWALISMALGLRAAGKLRVAEAIAATPPVLSPTANAPVASGEPALLAEPKQVGATGTV